jgi:hypothetical protein
VVRDIPIPVVDSEFLFLKALQYGVLKALKGYEENNLCINSNPRWCSMDMHAQFLPY